MGMKKWIRLAIQHAEMKAQSSGRESTIAPVPQVPANVPTLVARVSYHIHKCPCPVHPDGKANTTGRCNLCAREYRKLNYDIKGNSAHDQYLSMRARAKRKGIEFTLTFGAYLDVVSQPCFYAINWHPGIKSGIDRKEPRLGYTIENSVPCCAKHNLFKSYILTTAQTKDAVRRYQVSCENTLAGRKKSARILPDNDHTGLCVE
jgi:hypothetical protein